MRWAFDLPVDEMVAHYRAGKSLRVLGDVYGVSREVVRVRLKTAGVKMRPVGGQAGNKSNLGHYKRGGPLYIGSQGYFRTLDRAGKQCSVHRGCWEACSGAVPDGYHVHHENGNPLDNRIENLRCLSPKNHGRLHHGYPE